MSITTYQTTPTQTLPELNALQLREIPFFYSEKSKVRAGALELREI